MAPHPHNNPARVQNSPHGAAATACHGVLDHHCSSARTHAPEPKQNGRWCDANTTEVCHPKR
eukprot:scaffold9345_cov84-Isochrysis_galbana.AAC.2